MELATLILTIIAFIFFVIYLFFTWNFNHWKKRGIKGPSPVFLFGNVPNAILQKKSMFLDIEKIYREYKSVDKFIGFYFMRKPQIMVIDPTIARNVLVTNFKSFGNNDIEGFIDTEADPIFAKNPFVLNGQEWKEKRAEITPGLTALRIKASYPIMLDVCNKMTKFLEYETKVPPKNGFDARKLAARYTMDVVSNCIFGFDAGTFKPGGEKCEIMNIASGLLDLTFFHQLYISIATMFPKIRLIYNRPFLSKHVQDYLSGLMDHAIKLRKENQTDRIDFLNYLLQLKEKKNLSLSDMASHTITFFFDGFETSSILISNCLYFLGQHEDVQNKLRESIKQYCSSGGKNEISFENLSEMSSLDNIINETLRILPPGAIMNKLCTESTEFINAEGKSISIKKGDSIAIPILCFQTDEQYYVDADKFIPDRFSEENGGVKKFKDMGVFLPFSDGPRACLGQKFALIQSKAAIVELVKNWKITLNKKTRDKFEPAAKTILYLPEGGVWVNFEKI